MVVMILYLVGQPLQKAGTSGYIVGAIISAFILGYLIYTLIKPENF